MQRHVKERHTLTQLFHGFVASDKVFMVFLCKLLTSSSNKTPTNVSAKETKSLGLKQASNFDVAVFDRVVFLSQSCACGRAC